MRIPIGMLCTPITALAFALLTLSAGAAPPDVAHTTPTQVALKVDRATEPACKITNATIQSRTNLRLEPSYFAKVYASRDVAGIIANNQVYVLNLKSGRLTPILGTYDPVPTPDEKFLVTINNAGYEPNLRYFLTSDVLDRPAPAGGIASWPSSNFEMSYAYESIGDLPGTDLKRNYRLLVDNDKGQIFTRDLSFTFKSSKDTVPTLHEGGWQPLCSNVGALKKLPMISKDGKKVSIYNVAKAATEVYDINDNGTCKLNQTLPFQTGKADFSFDGKKVAFHMGRTPESAQWFKTADTHKKMDIFVWDLETKKLTRVTNTDIGNAYFPTFRKDGTLGFLEQDVKNGRVSYSYVLADPKLGAEMSESFPSPEEDCHCDRPTFAALAGVGALRDQLCSNLDSTMSLETEAALPLALNHDQCVNMVNSYWDKSKAQVVKKVAALRAEKKARPALVAKALQDLSAKDLAAACPGGERADSHATESSSDPVLISHAPPDRLKALCTECHVGDHPPSGVKFDLANVLGMPPETRQMMADQIKARNMPPGGLNDDEIKTLVEYLTPTAGH